jgi:hypothetical protein
MTCERTRGVGRKETIVKIITFSTIALAAL